MPVFSAKSLAGWTGGKWVSAGGGASVRMTGFSTDTRALEPGQVFVALRTGKRDGHDFLGEAKKAGASAAIVERVVEGVELPVLVVEDSLRALQSIAREHRRLFKGPVVAVTGSAGKTSTKDLLALLLGKDGSVLATEENFNNGIGVALTLARIERGKHRFAVVEAGVSEPGEMGVLASMIEPDVVVTTMVGAAHLEGLGSVDGVAEEKAVLSGALREKGVAVMTAETEELPAFRVLKSEKIVVERDEVFRLAEPPAGRVLFNMMGLMNQTTVSVVYKEPGPRPFTFPRVSEGQATNAVLAICAALRLGVKPDLIQARIVSWKASGLRGEMRYEDGRMLYLDCYNANPASMRDALRAFEERVPVEEKRLFVLGGMEELGAESGRFHYELGKGMELREGDFLMAIGDFAEELRRGAMEAGAGEKQVLVVESLEPVKRFLADWKGAIFMKGSRRWALEKALVGPVNE